MWLKQPRNCFISLKSQTKFYLFSSKPSPDSFLTYLLIKILTNRLPTLKNSNMAVHYSDAYLGGGKRGISILN